MSDSRHKGEIAQLKVMLRTAEKGMVCSKPCMDGVRYDLIVDDGVKLNRVQVKYGDGKSSVTCGSTGSIRVALHKRNSGGKGKLRAYSDKEIDAVVVYLPCIDKLVWLPPSVFADKEVLHLRVTKSLNNQTKGVLSVDDFIW